MRRSPQRGGLILLTSLAMAMAQFAQAQSTISDSDVARLKAFIGSTDFKSAAPSSPSLTVVPSFRVFIPFAPVTR